MPRKSARISRTQKTKSEDVSENLFDAMAPRFKSIIPRSLESRWTWLWEPVLTIELRNHGTPLLELIHLQAKHRMVLAALCYQGVSMRTIKKWNLDDPRMSDWERSARVRVHLGRSAAHFAKSGKDPLEELNNPSLLTPEARTVRVLMISHNRMKNTEHEKKKQIRRSQKQIDAMLQAGERLAARIGQHPLIPQRVEKPKPSAGEAVVGGLGPNYGRRMWRPKQSVVLEEDS